MLAQAERQAQAAEIFARWRVQEIQDQETALLKNIAELEQQEAYHLDTIAKNRTNRVKVEAVPQKPRAVEQDGGSN